MLINISSVEAQNMKRLSSLILSPPEWPNVKNFPALILDRYSGIAGLEIWSRVGEEKGLEEWCHSVYVGAFCAISRQVMFLIDVDHDYMSVSMSGQVPTVIPVSHNKRRKGSIIIQNDVWIGYGATILGGVTVHNGAVIAANATVTKDVPPYAIVAGNPARVIKYRFDPETIERLQRIQWWYWDEETIKERSEWFQRSPEEFAKWFDTQTVCKALDDEQLENILRESRFLTFADLDDPHSVLFKVIRDFSSAHAKGNWLIVAAVNDGEIEHTMRKIYGITDLIVPWEEIVIK